ncbi:ubiquitin-associated protein 1-like [Gigantopelta aegis]|uniref:ubiquitin-associated protein 1-like n=1 Tax=Gigantopelta aegis TaxID=1735272 RepID=UPI001B88795E|nr:ubiquitin-associated protein 1-like [Gigantopelta aegis]
MSFESHHSGSSSTGVLASSNSYLDGVPFKIGLKFRPPPRLLCLDEIKNRPKCQALNEEYFFETEEAVLAWAQARAKAREEQKKQAQSEPVDRNVNGVDSDSDDSSSTEDVLDFHVVNSAALGNNQSTCSPAVAPKEPSSQPQPVAAAMSADILTPVPITSASVKPPSSDRQVVGLDLALFEKEEDLFDNIDRQMINEMEELKTVLQPPPPPPPPSSSGDVNFSCNSNVDDGVNNAVEAVTGIPCPSKRRGDQCNGVTDSDCDKDPCAALPVTTKPVPAVRKSKLPPNVFPAEGDYVELRKDFSSSSVFFSKSNSQDGGSDVVDNSVVAEILSNKQPKPYSDDAVEHRQNTGVATGNMKEGNPSVQQNSCSYDDVDGAGVLGGKLPLHMANSGVFKPVLPPIQPTLPPIQPAPPPKPARPAPPPPEPVNVKTAKRHSLVDFLPPKKPTQPVIASDVAKHSVSQSDGNPVLPARFSYVGPSSPASNIIGNKYSRYSEGFTSSSNSDRDSSSPARSNSSNSDHVHSSPSKQVGSGLTISVTPPPRPSSQQSWNPYKPLPSPGVGSRESSSSDLCNPTEFDPYSALSADEQKFVDNLTAMGFSRPLVGRAVVKLGTNEREVLDYLDNVDKMSEKGFSPVLSESALQLFDNNSKKAEEYLTLYTQFQELGFGGEKIKEALVKENLDRDKALDILTSY